MKTTKHLLLIPALLLFASCGRNEDANSSKETEQQQVSISFSGAFALYPLAQKWAEAYNKMHPDVRFDIQAGGAGKGMTDALTGAVDIGMFSREITDVEKSKGVWYIALCKDAVIPTINPANPYINTIRERGITKDQFKAIFVDQSVKTWDDLLSIKNGKGAKIDVFTRSDASGAADSWAAFFGKKQENLKGLGMNGDPGVSDAVKKDKNGIGYNNTLFLYNIKTGKQIPGIEAVPIDVNGNGKIDADEKSYGDLNTFLKAVNDGKYPAPPARDLYFVTKGKPVKKEVLDFFNWVLKDGQQLVQSAGYVPLPQNVISEQINKLK
ncbi:PstS family phosphate ABC transporter substrate-binding protein [Ilyomonas limi]|uniref:PstS family phosphate ABC transporter substrate-binding protein n=1 Tax=Ilyomonas limi TaxID=2575867 RepID=A0A4U3L0Z4_9BACT|nr:PstS family phosphate ABC transporter substrate-binding protein [Ilyomonas limi]TKK67146.1 PstS family phosphate ABC transporter substrate-binding protein [Ilyomonas limi]